MVRPLDMQLSRVFIAFFMRDQAFPHVFVAFCHLQGSFLEPIGLSWGLLFEMVVVLCSILGILWVQNGASNVEMRVSKAILAQVEVAMGSQRLSKGRFWEDVHHSCCAILVFWYIFCKQGFVHVVAASQCSHFS